MATLLHCIPDCLCHSKNASLKVDMIALIFRLCADKISCCSCSCLPFPLINLRTSSSVMPWLSSIQISGHHCYHTTPVIHVYLLLESHTSTIRPNRELSTSRARSFVSPPPQPITIHHQKRPSYFDLIESTIHIKFRRCNERVA